MAENNTSNIGFEKQIWDAACVLRGNIDASEYKSVVLGLIFLKYISDRFEAKYKELVEEGDGFEEDQDEYTAENIFFVPENARWSAIAAAAHTPEIGTVIDDAMRSIEKENKRLKDILVYDIIYCAHTYNFYSTGMIQTTSTKERIKKAQLRDEIDSLETQLAETEQLLRQLENDAAEVVNMVGQIVEHRQFGKGTIISQTKDFQLIAFSTGEKKFQYPAAYVTGFLKADEAAMESIRKMFETEQRIKSTKNMITALTAQIKKLKKEN